MLTAIVSGKAAPGASTTTWALSLVWPRPVVTVDADPAGGDLVAGLLLGRVQADHGVVSWSAAVRRATPVESAALIGEHVVAVPEASQVWVMPGFQNAAQAVAVDAGGLDRMARALDHESSTGRDVIVDTGRLGDSSCWPVIRAAGRVVLVCRRSGRSIHAARNAAVRLTAELGDLRSVGLVVVDDAGPYDSASISKVLDVPLLGELPADRAAALVLSDGAASSWRGLQRSKLLRAARSLADEIGGPRSVNVPTGSGVGR